MIKGKEEIKKEVKEKMRKLLEEYVEMMNEKSEGEYYPIDEIEKDLLDIQAITKDILTQTTEELLNSVNEEKEILKKRNNLRKKS